MCSNINRLVYSNSTVETDDKLINPNHFVNKTIGTTILHNN